MKKLKLLSVKMCTLLCLTACTATSESGNTSRTYEIEKIETPAELIVLTGEQCLVTPLSEEIVGTETAPVIALLAATLIEAAVSKGFEAFNAYAISKATEDVEGKTFSANTTASAVTTTMQTSGKNGELVANSLLNIGCITVIKESNIELKNSNWQTQMDSKFNHGGALNTLLVKNGINYVPSLLFQIAIKNSKDRTSYIVEPAILSYMHRLGAKQSSKDMDLAITIEISEPSKADSPSHQMAFTYKDLKPQQLFLNKTKSFYTQNAYPSLTPDTLLSKQLSKAKALNTTLYNAESAYNTAQTIYEVSCSDETSQDTDDCKKLKTTLTSKNAELQAASKAIQLFLRDFSTTARTKSNLVNIKATVTEVGDVDKFWKALAFTSETLQPTIEEYVKTKSDKVFDNYSNEEKIANSNNELNYQIAIINFDSAYIKLKALNSTSDGYVDAKIACLSQLKTLTEAGINAGKAVSKTCD